MITIRQSQITAFSSEALRVFEEAVLRSLYQRLPQHLASIGEHDARTAIREGVRKAASYGIVLEVDVAKFIELLFMFGPDFDKNPAYARLHEVLNDPGLRDGSIKSRALVSAAMRHLLEVRAETQVE